MTISSINILLWMLKAIRECILRMQTKLPTASGRVRQRYLASLGDKMYRFYRDEASLAAAALAPGYPTLGDPGHLNLV